VAPWLSPAEKHFMVARNVHHPKYAELSRKSACTTTDSQEEDNRTAHQQAASSDPHGHVSSSLAWPVLRETFGRWSTWFLAMTNFFMLLPIYSLSFFLPTIIGEFGVSHLTSNLLSAIPYSVATVFMIANSIHSDRKAERMWHLVMANVLGAVGCVLLICTQGSGAGAIVLKLIWATVIACGVWGSKPILIAWVTSLLRGNMAVGIAFISALGNVAGIVGPLLMGLSRAHSGSYLGAYFLLFAYQVLSSILPLPVPRIIAWEEEKRLRKLRDAVPFYYHSHERTERNSPELIYPSAPV